MSWQLLIDTSLRGVALGLSPLHGDRKGELAWFGQCHEVNNSAQVLPILLNQGIAAARVELKDIVGIGLGAGPGSFTGLRVGLSYAYGVMCGLNATRSEPVLIRGSSSLAQIAANIFSKDPMAAIVLPSTKSTGYIAFQRDGDSSIIETSLDLDQDETLAKMLSSSSEIFCLGDWPRLLAVAGVVKVITLDVSESVVDALRGLARTGCEHWPDGFSHTLPELKYLKLSSVEENQNLKQNQNKR